MRTGSAACWRSGSWPAGGERVLDVPAKLAARAWVFDTGQGLQDRPC
jgi:hypothetical protein